MSNRDRTVAVAGDYTIELVIPSPMPRRIWLIRHGESKANAGLATCDPVSTDLTFTGHEQAMRIANVCSEPPSLVIVSQYQRTRQTALPTLQKFAIEPEVWDVHEFTYLAKLHGQVTTKQERSKYVDAYWNQPRPAYIDGVGSESFVDFFLRTQRVVQQLLSMNERFIMVFSHEQFITAARWILVSDRTFRSTDINVDMMTGFRHALTSSPIPNAAILPVSLRNNKPRCGNVITSHLSNLLYSNAQAGHSSSLGNTNP